MVREVTIARVEAIIITMEVEEVETNETMITMGVHRKDLDTIISWSLEFMDKLFKSQIHMSKLSNLAINKITRMRLHEPRQQMSNSLIQRVRFL